MRGLHGALLVMLGLLGASTAQAENRDMQCPVLSVGSFDWSRSPCVVQEQDKTIYLNWQGEGGRKHWMRLDLSDGGYMADAAWNGITAEANADDDLGKLIKSGDCWFGHAARFCLAPAEQAATQNDAVAGDPNGEGEALTDLGNAPVGREAELDGYYPCAAHRSLEDKERLNDYANATKSEASSATVASRVSAFGQSSDRRK